MNEAKEILMINYLKNIYIEWEKLKKYRQQVYWKQTYIERLKGQM